MSQKTVNINNVNEESGTATVTVSVGGGTNYLPATATISVTAEFSHFDPGVAPSFNANNFAALDKTATRKYYFGQYGNAFYGVSDGSISAVSGTGQASGQVPYWELVDTDSSINGISLSSKWGSAYNGQTILNYANGLKNTYFGSADQVAMKHAGSNIVTNDDNPSGTGSISAFSAYLWPLSYTQLFSNTVLCGALFVSGRAWMRSLSYAEGFAHYIYNSAGSIGNDGTVTTNRPVSPAFNLDLSKVLLGKTATKDSIAESITYIGTKVSEDLKFLINTGTVKASSFTINKKGEYTGAVTTTINGGTNYISEIIYDSTGKSLYYGNLGTVSSSSGSVELTIPDGIASGTYTLAVFEEEKCAAYKTDYACTPVYFSFTV